MYFGDCLIYRIEDIGVKFATKVYAMELGGEGAVQRMNDNLAILLVRHLVSITDSSVQRMERVSEVGTSVGGQLRRHRLRSQLDG